MNNNFIEIDKKNWERLDEFNHFQKIPCSFSMTAKVEITNLYKFSKQNNFKLYPCLIGIMAQVLNENKEYRFAYKNNILGYYEVLHPLFFDKMENNNIKVMCAEYNFDLKKQIKNIETIREKYKNINKYMPQENMPENVVNISCIPWVNFTDLSFNLPYAKEYFTPIIIFGKFEKNDNKIIIPVSVFINHSINDGYHGSMLFKKFEEKIKNLKD